MKNKTVLFPLTFLVLVFFISCASKPKFRGNGDLCGLVIDEKNRPVKDFLIFCDGPMNQNHTALTNDGGVFVIPDVPGGNYIISGKKLNYSGLEKTTYFFCDRTKIFCCQVSSIDATLESVSNLLIRGENQLAENQLNSLSYEKNSAEEAVVNFYRFYLAESKKEKIRIISKIRRISKQGKCDYSAFADSLEELVNEEK